MQPLICGLVTVNAVLVIFDVVVVLMLSICVPQTAMMAGCIMYTPCDDLVSYRVSYRSGEHKYLILDN